MVELKELEVTPDMSLRSVMEYIDRSGKGIALVLDADQHLIDTVTDGDIRRAILAGTDLNVKVSDLLAQRQPAFVSGPVTAPVDADEATLLKLMTETGVRHIPLVDEAGRVFDVALLSELARELPLRAVVMAGGYGTRLRPLTDELPKPMLPLGSRPLLELIIEQLKEAGIRQVNVATHYKGEMIDNHFKDGQDFGVKLRYVQEDQPLGPVGYFSLI